MYVAVLPERASSEGGGSVDGALQALQSDLGRPGTYAIVVGRRFRAGSTDLPEGAAGKAADAALKAERTEGLSAILLGFADRIGEVRAGGEPAGDEGGGGPGLGGLILLGVVVGGGALLITTRTRKRRREQAAELEEVRGQVREDVVELGEEIRALDLDVQMPGASEEAKRDYEQALGAYERASSAVDTARSAPRPRARRQGGRGGPLRDGVGARPARGPRAARAHAAVLLRPAPRPVGARGPVVAAVGRAARRAGL